MKEKVEEERTESLVVIDDRLRPVLELKGGTFEPESRTYRLARDSRPM